MRSSIGRAGILTAISLMCAVTAAGRAQSEPGFEPLFDGRTLTGWKAPAPSYWSIEDGAITGTITDQRPCLVNQYLVWQGGALGDFELKLQSRILSPHDINGGFQFRSRLLPDNDVAGYQVDNQSKSDWLVRLYDEHGRHALANRGQKAVLDSMGKVTHSPIREGQGPAPFRLDEWHEYHLICHGPRIVLKVNGQTMAEVIDNDPKQQDLSGMLALQLHSGPACKVQFKDIRLRRTSQKNGTDAGQPPVRAETLISAGRNLRLDTWEWKGREVTPDCPTPWSARKITLHGGRQEGVEVVVVDNGRLQLTVVPTRGMGVLSVTMGDVSLGWDSPVKEVVHPRTINLESRGGLGWLEGFNEWMCRCGLEYSGHPGTDRFINNVGDEASMELTLHGRVANLPASEVEVAVDPQPPFRISVRGRVEERMFYGPKLEVQTEISTEPGSNRFRISDVITNAGGQEQEFQMIYHCNYGPPLLESGSVFVGALERVTPFNARAAEGLAAFDQYAGPQDGFVEQVYCLRPRAGADGQTMAMLRNKAGDRAVSMAWSVKELPYLTLWKNTNSLKEGYVTGIEPGTSFPSNRRVERKHGRVPKLAAGATHRMSMDFAIHASKAEVTQEAERIRAIQSDRRPTLDAQPESND